MCLVMALQLTMGSEEGFSMWCQWITVTSQGSYDLPVSVQISHA